MPRLRINEAILPLLHNHTSTRDTTGLVFTGHILYFGPKISVREQFLRFLHIRGFLAIWFFTLFAHFNGTEMQEKNVYIHHFKPHDGFHTENFALPVDLFQLLLFKLNI